MNQLQQQSLVQLPNQPEVKLVQVGDRLYRITELSQSPQTITPEFVDPHSVKRSSLFDNPNTVILMGVGCVVLGGCIAWVIVKAFAPPVPTIAPTQPQTVIVQPPQPEKKPYTREECRPAGLFGWGQDCYRERGYQ